MEEELSKKLGMSDVRKLVAWCQEDVSQSLSAGLKKRSAPDPRQNRAP